MRRQQQHDPKGKDVIEASQLYRALVAAQGALGVGLAVVDERTGRYVSVNDALAMIYGSTPEKLLALPNYLDPLAEEHRPAADGQRIARLRRDPALTRRTELTVVRGDGSRIRVDAALHALEDDRAVMLVRQVTEQDPLAPDRAERFRALVERVPAVVYEAEPGAEGRWRYVSPYVETMLGYPPDDWLAQPDLWAARLHPEDRATVLEQERRLEHGERLSVEYRMLARDGSVVWVHDEAVPRHEDGVLLLDGLLTEVGDRKVAEARLQHLADHDGLTGMLNHRRFVEELELEVAVVRRGMRSSSAIVLDIDGFKHVNDSFGHQAGDELLRAIASVLSERLRTSDAVARLGGDEFACLLRGTRSEGAAVVAGELLERLREHRFAVGGADSVRVTASAGVAGLEESEHGGAEAVLSAADVAMYEGKRAGRDRVQRFTPRVRAELERGRTWVAQLIDALEHDRFVLFAQPVLDLKTGAVAQHELLLRLPGEDGELAGPDAFLPVAERFDLVEAIDHWVLTRVIALLRDPATGDLVFEVNLAARSIGSGQVVPLLEREIAAGGVDPSRLIVEVTETAAMANMQGTREFADALGGLGVRMALDDFGSGFGSFYYLKHLPVDYLKIDGEFIAKLPANPVDQEVVKAIVMLARAVGRRTIAEFVPDQATQELLAEFGVDLAQGFHVGRPRPVEELW